MSDFLNRVMAVGPPGPPDSLFDAASDLRMRLNGEITDGRAYSRSRQNLEALLALYAEKCSTLLFQGMAIERAIASLDDDEPSDPEEGSC